MPTETVKPGYKTTEFWVTVATTLWGIVMASGFIPADNSIVKIVGAIIAAVAPSAYSVSRGIAKK